MLTYNTKKASMLNIEIHGMDMDEARKMQDAIFILFIKKPYLSNMVATIFNSSVMDYVGRHQPFLRVSSPLSEHLDEVMEALKTFKMNMEVNILTAFYPKEGHTQ